MRKTRFAGRRTVFCLGEVTKHTYHNGIKSFWIANNIVVPESFDAMAVALNCSGPLRIHILGVLAAIDLNDQSSSMAHEVGEIWSYRCLTTKMPIVEMFAKHPPSLALGIRHIPPQPARCLDGRFGKLMLHALALSTSCTPPQPLPIEGGAVKCLASARSATAPGRNSLGGTIFLH